MEPNTGTEHRGIAQKMYWRNDYLSGKLISHIPHIDNKRLPIIEGSLCKDREDYSEFWKWLRQYNYSILNGLDKESPLPSDLFSHIINNRPALFQLLIFLNEWSRITEIEEIIQSCWKVRWFHFLFDVMLSFVSAWTYLGPLVEKILLKTGT